MTPPAPQPAGALTLLAMLGWTLLYAFGWTALYMIAVPFIGIPWASWIAIFGLMFAAEGALEHYVARARYSTYALRLLLFAWIAFVGGSAMMRHEELMRSLQP